MWDDYNNEQLDELIARLEKAGKIDDLAAACTERERRKDFQIRMF